MLTLSDLNLVQNYVIKKVNYGSEKNNLTKELVYVDRGFYNILLYPIFPMLVIGHILYFYGLYVVITQGLWTTLAFSTLFIYWSGISAMAGSHRLWCHRSYEAKTPLKIFLALGQTMSGQFTIQKWAMGHRTHHKFSDSDADPHNVKRGFTFAHIGWMVMPENPLVEIKGSTIDFSDLRADPIVKHQNDNYNLWYFFCAFLIPTSSAVIFLGDTWLNAFLIMHVMRLITVLHGTILINSAAHMFGEKPFNEKIASADNAWTSVSAFGEGYHNYHHSFPWDYAAGELGCWFNVTKKFIDVMEWCGQAYNLKRTSADLQQKCRERVIENRKIKGIAFEEEEIELKQWSLTN